MLTGAGAGAAAVPVMNAYQAAVNAASKCVYGEPALNLDDAATRDVAQSLGVPFAAVQYGAGISLGALYGLFAESFPAATAGGGTGFGAAAWLLGDEIVVPMFGLAQGCEYDSISGHVNALAGHVVFGAVTHYLRKALCAYAR